MKEVIKEEWEKLAEEDFRYVYDRQSYFEEDHPARAVSAAILGDTSDQDCEQKATHLWFRTPPQTISARGLKGTWHFPRSVRAMASDWDEDGFLGLVRRYFDVFVGDLSPERKITLINSIYDLGLTIHHGDLLNAKQLYEELQRESPYGFQLHKCLVLCGAGASCPLVRYMMEDINISIIDLLTSWDYKNDHGENALHIAIGKSRNDVVDYLLNDWMQTPLSVAETRSSFVPSDIFSGKSLYFNSSEYFENFCKALSSKISVSKGDDKKICYFLQRIVGRWTRKEYFSKNYWDYLTLTPETESSQHDLQEVLQAIYNDEEFFNACLRVQDIPYLTPLWEIYGHEPKLFHLMADWAASVDAHIFFNRDLLESQRENKSGANFTVVFQVWSQSHHPKLVHTALFLTKLQQDWNSMQKSLLSSGLKVTLPFSNGLHLFFRRLLFYAVKIESDAAVNMMRQLPPPSHASAPTNEPPEPRGEFMCNYLLASAGSGKTQCLMDKLSTCYGFYLSSGAINDGPMDFDDGEALYQPRTIGSSRDTKLLFDTTQVPWLSNIDIVCLPRRCNYLLHSRLDLFLRVIELSKNQSLGFTLSPQTWLQYQLSCQSERDSFSRIFQLSIIADCGYPEWNPCTIKKCEILWCFDEVQCDISEVKPPLNSTESTTVLGSLIQAVREVHSFRTEADYTNHISLLSGTALNIDKVRATIHKSDQWPSPPIEKVMPSCPLVTDNQTFRKVYDYRRTELLKILHDSNSPKNFVRNMYCRDAVFIPANERTFNRSHLFEHFQAYRSEFDNDKPKSMTEIIEIFKKSEPQILQNSVPFRGRYRWSVYYVEKLLEKFFIKGTLNDKFIDEVTEDAKRDLKQPLKERLKDLVKVPAKTSILEDIFNMAFDADLFGRSRILDSKSSPELIEQALGYVESATIEGVKTIKVSLAERLVVDSVIEYLRETGQLETLINKYIYAIQFYPGAFGDSSEESLAFAIYQFSSQILPQRWDFVSLFDTVYRISTTGCKFNHKLDLANYFFSKGDGLRKDYMPDSSKNLGLTEWLQLVLEEKPRPTFLFPEQVAGPDLMFVYKERDGKKRVVFAIQLKTGSVSASKDSTINTLDPDRWFSKNPNLKSAFQGVLQACSKDDTISFFSVLLAAGKEMSAPDKHEHALQYMQKRVSISPERKEALEKALGELKGAENHYQNSPTKDVANKLEEAKEKFKKEVRLFEEKPENPAAAGGDTSTTYDFQILADDSVEKVFGHVFQRLIRALKSGKTFKDAKKKVREN